MPDYTDWLAQGTSSINAVWRAVRAWKRISDRVTSITVYRGRVAQTAQSVRIEYDSIRGLNVRHDAGEAVIARVILFGVADHPTVTDTNLQKGDQFTLADGMYEVKSVIYVPGEVQATAERIS
jgi:hypothetical protein